MAWREKTPKRLRGGGDLAAAWILVAALLIGLAAATAIELDLLERFLLG